MTMKDEKWIYELRRRMADYDTTPPEGLWDSIESAITDVARPTPAGRQRFITSWRHIGVAAAVLFIVFVFGWLPLSDTYTPPVSKMADYSSAMPRQNKTASLHPSEYVATSPRNIIHNSSSICTQDSTPATPPVTISCDTAATVSSSPDVPQTQSASTGPTHRQETTDGPNLIAVTGSSKRTGRLSASFGISNRPGTSSASHEYSGLIAGYFATEAATNKLPQADDPLCELMRNNIGKDVHTDTRHHQPVKAGVSINYNLTERLSLECGFTYAYLTSSTTSGSDSHRFETDQRLHYIGIPFGINYTMFQSRRLSLYLSAGASMEKCISGRLDTDYINNGVVTESDSEQFRPRKLQWSANIGAGIQYSLTPVIGIYAEPGISHYFGNSSRLETFYTARPLNFNLEAGIRLNIN